MSVCVYVYVCVWLKYRGISTCTCCVTPTFASRHVASRCVTSHDVRLTWGICSRVVWPVTRGSALGHWVSVGVSGCTGWFWSVLWSVGLLDTGRKFFLKCTNQPLAWRIYVTTLFYNLHVDNVTLWVASRCLSTCDIVLLHVTSRHVVILRPSTFKRNNCTEQTCSLWQFVLQPGGPHTHKRTHTQTHTASQRCCTHTHVKTHTAAQR